MMDDAPTSTSNSEVKYYSLNTSEGDKAQKSLSARKKPFTRKPAAQSCSSETRRKSREVLIQNSITDVNEVDIEPFAIDSAIKINFVKRKQRQTEFYNKQKEGQTSGRGKKDTSFSPFSSSKKNLQENVSYFYKKPAGKQYDTISNSQNCSQAYFSGHNSTKLIQTLEKSQWRPNNEEETPLGTPKKKADSQFANPPVLTFSYSKSSRLNFLAKSNQKAERPKQDNPTQFECSYCKNNKEMTDIMCEKYSKLQQQLKTKNEKIKELTFKYESLKEQHMKLSEKYEHKLEASQLKEIQFFREREQLMNRIDAFKSDLTKVCQKLKYIEIENSMLLRYKDEYQLLTKQYDIIFQENQRLQNSITQIRRGQRQDFFKKNKLLPSTPNSKNHQKIHLSNQKFNIEDDLMSLSLSQQSTDHF